MLYKSQFSLCVLTKIVFLMVLLMLSACAPVMTYYEIQSTPPGAKVYRGTSPNALNYYATTPFYKTTGGSLSWSSNYFQARKEGYADSPLYQQPRIGLGGRVRIHLNLQSTGGQADLAMYKQRNTLSGYYEFLGKFPKSTQKQQVFGLMVRLISLSASVNAGYKRLVDQYPDAATSLPESVRLNYVGPVGMKITDLRKLLKQGIGSAILQQKILIAGQPYAEFSFDEIRRLTKMGFSDQLVASMLRVTQEYKVKQTKQSRKAVLTKTSAWQRAGGGAIVTTTSQAGSNPVADKLKECAIFIAKKKVCDQIGGFGGMACMAMIPAGHNCF